MYGVCNEGTGVENMPFSRTYYMDEPLNEQTTVFFQSELLLWDTLWFYLWDNCVVLFEKYIVVFSTGIFSTAN